MVRERIGQIVLATRHDPGARSVALAMQHASRGAGAGTTQSSDVDVERLARESEAVAEAATEGVNMPSKYGAEDSVADRIKATADDVAERAADMKDTVSGMAGRPPTRLMRVAPPPRQACRQQRPRCMTGRTDYRAATRSLRLPTPQRMG
jgi:hypothetical protein